MASNKKILTCDVVVVGAGLVGLIAVIMLAEQGKQVILVDGQQKVDKQQTVKKIAQETQDFDARIYAITPSTEAFLKRLGVWSLLDLSRINDVEAMALWNDDVEQPLRLLANDAHLVKMACIVENDNLMQALWRKIEALDISLVMEASCRALHYDKDAVVLDLENDDQISASLIVAADGAHSFIRQQLAITTKTKTFNQTALVANYRAEKAHGNIARQWFASHETLAFLPLPQQQVSIVWAIETEFAQALLNLTNEALAERVQKRSNDVLGELTPTSQTFSFALKQVTANQLIADRVVLIGDAAHQVHPMAGQGANLGFRDVISLENIIANGHPMQDIGDCSFLRRYERERKVDILSITALTSGLDKLFSVKSKTIKKTASFGMQQLDKHPTIKKILIQQAIA
jgi:ubiquinone biosynthesis UbiH/UbiF/VisC/COQ6 family hydroxylase